MEEKVPVRRILSGADCFLLAVDHGMRRESGRGNVCQLLLQLDGTLSEETIRGTLAQRILASGLAELRIKRSLPFALPHLKTVSPGSTVVVREHVARTGAVIHEEFFPSDLRPQRNAMIAVDIVHQPDEQDLFIFSWNHALMDARGAERLVAHLGSAAEDELLREFLLPKHLNKKLPWRLKLHGAKRVKEFITQQTAAPMATLFPRGFEGNASCHYSVLSFSAEQTLQIAQNAQVTGAGWIKSAFYLAASVRAFQEVQKARGEEEKDVLVPVPQDLRKRGAMGPIVSNQVTFLFFRVPYRILHDLRQVIQCLIEQMQSFLRCDLTDDYSVFMDLCRRFPLSFYSHFLKLPTQGQMASFYFSDTGRLLGQLEEFMELKVKNAIHYPPNTVPPGLTLIFSQFMEGLNVTIASADSALNPEELRIFIAHLQADLLGE